MDKLNSLGRLHLRGDQPELMHSICNNSSSSSKFSKFSNNINSSLSPHRISQLYKNLQLQSSRRHSSPHSPPLNPHRS